MFTNQPLFLRVGEGGREGGREERRERRERGEGEERRERGQNHIRLSCAESRQYQRCGVRWHRKPGVFCTPADVLSDKCCKG